MVVLVMMLSLVHFQLEPLLPEKEIFMEVVIFLLVGFALDFNKLLCCGLPFLIYYIQYTYNVFILYIQTIFSQILNQINKSFPRPFFRWNFGLFLSICKDKFYDKENYLRRFSCQNIQTI